MVVGGGGVVWFSQGLVFSMRFKCVLYFFLFGF